MTEVIEVETGKVVVAKAPARLRASALGSCVAVVLYDSSSQVGGLAHVMLPSSDTYRKGDELTKYADYAIDHLIDTLVDRGADRYELRARLVGGAMITKDAIDIGAQVVRAVDDVLYQRGIEVMARRVGGSASRSVTFDLATGTVWYSEGGRPEKVL